MSTCCTCYAKPVAGLSIFQLLRVWFNLSGVCPCVSSDLAYNLNLYSFCTQLLHNYYICYVRVFMYFRMYVCMYVCLCVAYAYVYVHNFQMRNAFKFSYNRGCCSLRNLMAK